MKIYHLQRVQTLPVTIAEAWTFFSSPENLARITPPDMHFKILTSSGGKEIYAGQLIEYKIRIMPMVSFHWTTEITHVDKPYLFVDEQRFGPYAFWHHQHHFRTVNDHVEMTDALAYGLPFGIIGRIAHAAFVEQRVKAIFEYRTEILKKILGTI